MRPLDEKETTLVFNKLHKFVGNNLKNIVLESQSHEGPDSNPGRYCFRLQKNRVYYVSESLIKRATNIKREKLVSLGTQIGKFTKAGKFHLTIQSLNLLAANAKHKVWLKPTSEMSFFVWEQCVERWGGEDYGEHSAKSTVDCRKMDPNGIVVHRHADIGEYLRMEDDL
ncbi:UNVERIFIED_CONTAM: 60S ribosome subunit biogenesis protein NIP7 [Sesamum radiatum]|uniref:60S ribosome subunit biogenesis protein NIP7 homolog n=1 Tax=Sesamum radiatum TaxID=300843 RepID=A0AAW2UEL3_SESRA